MAGAGKNRKKNEIKFVNKKYCSIFAALIMFL
jgi:hypothetical protein